MLLRILLSIAGISLLAACANKPVVDNCSPPLGRNLESAMQDAESRLGQGCEYHFDNYFQQLLAMAEANPNPDNKALFSDHLVEVNEMGVISRRQAREMYNRYFNVKFVAFTGDYNTCSQACPIQNELLSKMKSELRDKELGLLKASDDKPGYYRADHLLQETQLVLEATCRACAAGEGR